MDRSEQDMFDASASRQLWKTTLEYAIEDIIGGIVKPENNESYNKRKLLERYANDARRWLMRDSETGIGSFKWICTELGFNYKKVRMGILNNLEQIKIEHGD